MDSDGLGRFLMPFFSRMLRSRGQSAIDSSHAIRLGQAIARRSKKKEEEEEEEVKKELPEQILLVCGTLARSFSGETEVESRISVQSPGVCRKKRG